MRFKKEVIESKKALRMPISSAVKSFDDATRTITFIASNESVDRYGDIIRVAGWDTKAYENNPVILWAHDSSQPPIGKCVGIKKDGTQLLQTVQFADAATYEFADTIYKLYKGGYLNAVSVGFIPQRYEYLFAEDKDGNPDGWPIGCEFLEQELLELSCVPVPANAEAVALMMKGMEDGLSGAELAKATILGVMDKAVEDGAITPEACEALKAKMIAELDAKSVAVGASDGPKPADSGAQETVPETPAAEATKTDGADGTNTNEGTENDNEYIQKCMGELTAHVTKGFGDMGKQLDYAISTEGLRAANEAQARSISNLHTKVDSLHNKLNGKAGAAEVSRFVLVEISEDGSFFRTTSPLEAPEVLKALGLALEHVKGKAAETVADPAAVPPVEETKEAPAVTAPAEVVPPVVTVELSAEEIFFKSLLQPTSVAVEDITTQKDAPENAIAPEQEGNGSQTVKEFLAALCGSSK